MSINTINPLADSVLRPGDPFSFTIDDTYSSLTIEVIRDEGTEFAYDTSLGGAQSGYDVTVLVDGSEHIFTVARTSGWDNDPQQIRVVENETGSSATTTFNYFLTDTKLYPDGMNPYNLEHEGTLIISETGVKIRGDVTEIDVVGATVVSLGVGKVRLSIASGAGHIIQEEGSNLTVRPDLNFKGGIVTASDNAGNNATDVDLPNFGSGTNDVPRGDHTHPNVVTGTAGFAPSGSGDTSQYLDGTGAYTTPSGTSFITGLNLNLGVWTFGSEFNGTTFGAGDPGSTQFDLETVGAPGLKANITRIRYHQTPTYGALTEGFLEQVRVGDRLYMTKQENPEADNMILVVDSIDDVGLQPARWTFSVTAEHAQTVTITSAAKYHLLRDPIAGNGAGIALSQTKSDATEDEFVFDITSIPDGYDIYIWARHRLTTSTLGNLALSFNGSLGGTDYIQAGHRVDAVTGTSLPGNNGVNQAFISLGLSTEAGAAGVDPDDWTIATSMIPDGWKRTDTYTSVLGDFWSDGTGHVRGWSGGSWKLDTVVTALHFGTSGAQNFDTGTEIRILGVPKGTFGAGSGGGGDGAAQVFTISGEPNPLLDTWRTWNENGLMYNDDAASWAANAGSSGTGSITIDPVISRWDHGFYMSRDITITKVQIITSNQGAHASFPIFYQLWKIPVADGDTADSAESEVADVTYTVDGTTNKIYVKDMTLTAPNIAAGEGLGLYWSTTSSNGTGELQRFYMTIEYTVD